MINSRHIFTVSRGLNHRVYVQQDGKETGGDEHVNGTTRRLYSLLHNRVPVIHLLFSIHGAVGGPTRLLVPMKEQRDPSTAYIRINSTPVWVSCYCDL